MRAAALGLLLALVPASAVAGQQTHLLVVVGLGGDEEHRTRFHEWATALVDAALDTYSVPAENVRYLGETPEADPGRVRARSTREEIDRAVREIAGVAAPGDEVLIVVIGHGSARGGSYRIHLPGPDVGPEEVGLLLDLLASQRVAFVNTASASGGFADELAGPGRTIITATRTAREQNETVFPGYFVGAFTGETADLDKDGRVSLLEAFQYAVHEVKSYYSEKGLLQTEHARLVDDWQRDGDEVVDTPPDGARLARAVFLRGARPGGVPSDASPALAALLRQREELQTKVQELRAVRDALDASEYDRRLEELLVEIALVTRAIRDQGGGS